MFVGNWACILTVPDYSLLSLSRNMQHIFDNKSYLSKGSCVVDDYALQLLNSSCYYFDVGRPVVSSVSRNVTGALVCHCEYIVLVALTQAAYFPLSRHRDNLIKFKNVKVQNFLNTKYRASTF